MNAKTRIMLIEDHPKYRKVIEMALEKEEDMFLGSLFGAAEVALRNIKEGKNNPDLILLDLNLPGISGLEALPLITELLPEAKIIILTQSNHETDVLTAIQRGAAGYLLKKSTITQIKEAIRTVMQGGASLDGSVAQFILQKLQQKALPVQADHPLSDRELEILKLLGEGFLKKEIADQLNISFGSVATYIRRIYEKLQVENAPAAVAKAYKIGLFRPNR
ncbi:response regulator transcription factor [Pontiellaceae bacterium B1224]|nr:response regulator transcription factor [Pontiellaceae bacterium B1224]